MEKIFHHRRHTWFIPVLIDTPFLPLHSEMRMATILLSAIEKNMKKLSSMLVLLFCVTGLSGQDLFYLSLAGTPEQVQAAIDAGAKVNDHDEFGRTPLMLAAAKNNNPDVITTLLNAGADAKAKDIEGKTAFASCFVNVFLHSFVTSRYLLMRY